MMMISIVYIGRPRWRKRRHAPCLPEPLANLLNLYLDYAENLKLIFHEQDTLKNKPGDDIVFSLPFLQSKITEQNSSLINYIRGLNQEGITKYNKNILNKLTVSSPTKGFITSSFNIKDGHFGVDVAPEKNTSVFSVLKRVVLFSGYSGDFGNRI